METSLHRQLKLLYAAKEGETSDATEVRFGAYRIDALVGDELIEIQHGSLAAIRDKVRKLLEIRAVRVVKPIVARKLLIHLAEKGGEETSRRKSPKRGVLRDAFAELVYFRRVFPHPRLTVELLLVDVEEYRFPGHGKRRRRRERDFQVEDRRLVAVHESYHLRTAHDLVRLVGVELPKEFDTADLARAAEIPAWEARRIAYCWREMGAAEVKGKRGNRIVYRLKPARKRRRAA